MAKNGPSLQLKPNRIAALAGLLEDAVSEESEELDFLEDKQVAIDFGDTAEVDIVGMVDKALKEQALVPRDIKFDDSSMPRAKNFLEFTTSPNFLKVSPYLEQAVIGIRLFGEWCPDCSKDPEWLLTENHDPIEGLGAIENHIQLLEHGVCPKCKVGRAEHIRNGKLNFYNELAVNAGQRCVIGSTPILTKQGIVPIDHMIVGHTVPGFHKAPLNVYAHSGSKLQKIRQVYVSAPEPVKGLRLTNGMQLIGTPDHPVRTDEGFVNLQKIAVGTKVPIAVGTNSWGRLTVPKTIYEAGRSTREAALDFIELQSFPLADQFQYTGTEDQAQIVIAILLNAGYVPNIVRDNGMTFVQYDLSVKPIHKHIMLEVDELFDVPDAVTYDLQMEGLPQFVSAGFISHNSGKSIVVAMISAYQTHIILKSQNPCGILGIDQATVLHGTFVASTQKQAHDTLWTPYYNYIMASPWFQKYHALIRQYERKFGQEVMKVRDTFILYGHRNLVVYPAGPDGKTLRGRTRVLGALDEIAYFDNDPNSMKIKASATLVYGAMDRSMATVRAAQGKLIAADYNDAFTGLMLNVSSPLHARDKINELLRQSVGSKSLLGIHAPTWKMNPTMPRDCEFLVEAFRKNPIEAAKDYGAEAPLSANPFLTQLTYIENSIREKGRNLCVYQPHIIKHRDGSTQRYAKLVKVAQGTRPSILAIDAGLTNNSFAIVIGSRGEDGVISVDCLVEVMPKPGIPLNYSLIFDELLIPLCKERNVKVMLADQWNSAKLLQDAKLEIESIEHSDKYSLKYSDLWMVKTLIESESPRLTIPRMQHAEKVRDTLLYDQDEYPHCFEGKPTEHLIMQMQTVQDTGSQVQKNPGATDDLWRAMALMVYGFECGEYDEVLTLAHAVAVNRDPKRLGVIGGRRDSGSASSSGGGGSGRSLGVTRARLSGK